MVGGRWVDEWLGGSVGSVGRCVVGWMDGLIKGLID